MRESDASFFFLFFTRAFASIARANATSRVGLETARMDGWVDIISAGRAERGVRMDGMDDDGVARSRARMNERVDVIFLRVIREETSSRARAEARAHVEIVTFPLFPPLSVVHPSIRRRMMERSGRVIVARDDDARETRRLTDDALFLTSSSSVRSTPHVKRTTRWDFLFTSESVNEGHPDKLADQISDGILDACLEQDPDSKVACETATKTNMVMVFGEITTKAKVDYEAVVRQVCRDVGFISDETGLDGNKCRVLVELHDQSPDIGQGVHGMGTKSDEDVGAGDQGHMFGYATDETPELMPLTHVLATKLGHRLTVVRKDGTCPWVLPDGKTQVTIEYENENGAMVPKRVHTILISTQHIEGVTNEKIADDLMNEVIKKVVPEKYLDADTIFHLNPSGRFVIGGPHGDAGLTGRKIIIDTYGGWGAHGGGAFSGKDPTKVDRSGAYIARQAAKSIVAAGLARRALFQISYAIGVAEPLSVHVDTYGTGKIPDAEILEKVKKAFDFRPGMMGKALDLKRGGKKRYQTTAAYGHFGRDEDLDIFTWEKVVPL